MTALSSTLARARLPLDTADLRGVSRLVIDGVVGVTDVVEAMHLTIGTRAGLLRPGLAGRARGITGLAYGAVRGVTRLVGRGLDVALPLGTSSPVAATPERQALVSALNGIWGDHLEKTGNPLAIPMSLRIGGHAWRDVLQMPTAKVVVMVHGLGMNDLQWRRRDHDHGRMLASEHGYTPVYLHYNTGRHVSQNGRDFSALLDTLVADWPVPVEELVIVCHSMGGLVTRSACSVGTGRPWRRVLRKLVFLGTPHHGAPLERAGRVFDSLLAFSPYAAPLARLGRARSAGITDLRYGNLQDADWQHRDRHSQTRDDRVPTPLPRGVQSFVVAAVKGEGRWVGDGLVPLASALGEHTDPALALKVPKTRQFVLTSSDHWDLLSDERVGAQLKAWLG